MTYASDRDAAVILGYRALIGGILDRAIKDARGQAMSGCKCLRADDWTCNCVLTARHFLVGSDGAEIACDLLGIDYIAFLETLLETLPRRDD